MYFLAPAEQLCIRTPLINLWLIDNSVLQWESFLSTQILHVLFFMKVRNKLDCTDKSDVSLTSMYVQLYYTYGYIRIHTRYVSLCFCSYPFSLLNHLSFYLIGLTHSLYFSNIRWVGVIRLKTLSKLHTRAVSVTDNIAG